MSQNARVSHDVAVALRTMRLSLWQQTWRRLQATLNGRALAIYGAGEHTRCLLEAAGRFEQAPRLAFVLDDAPSTPAIAGVPVLHPDDANPGEIGCVLVSSDSIEDTLAERAKAWAAGRVAVELLYGDAELCRSLRMVNGGFSLVERTRNGDRRSTDQLGEIRVSRPTACPHRAPSAIDPVMERGIGSFKAPTYTVEKSAVATRLEDIYTTHQLYPSCEADPPRSLREECLVTQPEPGLITPTTRVSTIGSCFASNFKLWLVQNGYNFCQFEDGPAAKDGSLASGPVFNPGSLEQLFEWAYHGFDAADPVWRYENQLLDPYRRSIAWPDEASMHAEREAHFAAARSMIAESEVLIITPGLAEVWRNREDKRCYFRMPPPEMLDERYHEHALLSAEECLACFERAYELIRAHNPSLRVVLTLSPVPLVATSFDRHAVVSDAVSKATLRSAIHWFCDRHPEVVYFPSYEMVVKSPDWPYAEDNRHVERGHFVDRIMRTFLEHYGEPGEADRLYEPKLDALARTTTRQAS